MAESSRSENSSKAHVPRVLVVDDEEAFHRSVARYLEGFRVHKAYTGTRALETLSTHAIDVVLLDLGLPDVSGLDLLADIKEISPDTQVLVVTATSELRTAVAVVKAGAFDFLTKRHENYQALPYHIRRALENRQWQRQKIAASLSKDWHEDAFALLEQSDNQAVRATVRLAQKMAPTPLSVLIEGPSGSGKEIMARYVHAHSGRQAEPFIPINVGAVPEALMESQLFGHAKGAFTGAVADHVGKFELAGSGAIFLDEIGDLAPSCQVKLLRVLQEREVERVGGREARPIDCRVVAATNKNLQEEVRAGRFREDLYYRLHGVRLELPPLCERRGDIPALVDFLADKSARLIRCPIPTIEPEVIDLLSSYSWPGNIRELENLVMRLVATCNEGVVTSDDVPPEFWLPTLMDKARIHAASEPSEKRLYFLAREQFERYLVRYMVQRCRGNKKKAAQELGVSYSTVKEKSREPGE
jgi:DNA-binding NtrC family response regulator